MGLVLVVAGVLLWLLGGWMVVGIILIAIGVLMLFVPWDGAYGYSRWHARRGP